MLNEDDFDRIKSGDVLVCRTTTPTWNVVFGTVGAMVAEVGIVVSHVAIVAREFGLPAVVNVRNAPTTLRERHARRNRRHARHHAVLIQDLDVVVRAGQDRYDHRVYSAKSRPEDQLRTMNTDRKESQSLLNECAEWVAEQLEEENIFIDPGLVSLMMEVERRVGPPHAANQGIAEAIEALLVEDGVQGIPDTINAKLALAVLQWEDEFMALAGRPRPA